MCPVAPGAAEGEGEPPLRALRGFAADFARDLVFIVRVTVPWMLAAGLLGALVATLLPVQAVAGLPVTWITLLGVALLGVFLPVPIAFDVILAAALLAAGVPVAFVMTLLFTLGIFSVYSFAIVAGSMSRRAALYLVAVIAATGVASGRLAESYGAWEVERTLALLADEGEVLAAPLPAPGGDDAPEPSPAAGARAALVPFAVRAEGGGGAISVARSLFAPRSPAGERAFTRLEAHHRGVDRPNLFSIQDMKFPFVQAPGSIAAADLDGDGDPDLVVADNHRGVDVFHNDGHGHFTRAGLNLREVSARSVIIAAPVDVDDDGWLDLFLTTYREGNLLLRNDRGRFRNSGVERVGGRPGAVLANAVGFGDIDRDGDLDAVLGHYSGFAVFHARDARDRNRILFNEGGALSGERFADTAAVPGETLSVLLSDFDGDGDLDLIEGNDFEEPDAFHLGDGRGGFGKIRSEDGLIPVSAHTTMSIKTADLDNDLRMEIYVSQIAGRSENVSERLRLSSWDDYCRGIERPEDQAACQVNVDIRRWYPVATFRMDLRMARNCADLPAKARAECRAVLIRDIAVRTGRPGLCREIPRAQVRTRQLCELNARARIDPLATAEPEDGRQELLVTNRSYPGEIPQFFGGNVLLVDRGDGRFEDRARPAGLDIGGWSWDVKIHDFDLDGLQDVHIHNGAWQPEVVPSKIYKKNLGGMRFAETTEEAGLVDFLIVTSSAAADFDGDGDIDQIAQTLNGPLVAYWNNAQEGHAIAFAFRDEIGNHFGIGNKVVIHYGEAGRQIRELQLSGGYCSFDPPVAHFGLGAHDAVERVEVEWSTGERSILEGPFPAGATYRITRAEPAVAR